jgi:Ulp1 family protease
MERMKLNLSEVTKVPPGEWILRHTPDCPQQTENDCGPFVLMFASKLLKGKTNMSKIQYKDTLKMRQNVTHSYLSSHEKGREIILQLGTSTDVDKISRHFRNIMLQYRD